MQTPTARLSLISIGPGDLDFMIPAARAALTQADIVIGYQLYLEQIAPLLRQEQEIIVSQLGQEMARAADAVACAAAGKHVAMVSSGDIGIYAMASPIYDVLHGQNWTGENPTVQLFPGISAIQAAAAQLGAPLGHDFCTISLSDVLTPWPVIERRVTAAAWGDFVIGFYNPRSRTRDWQLPRALEILREHRALTTPAALIRNVTRSDQQITVTTLGSLDAGAVDMFTLVLIGNSQSYPIGGGIATPRGYTSAASNGGSTDQTDADIRFASLYPITLTQLNQQLAIVVGGGPVGTRKARTVMAAGGRVRLISPEATEEIQSWAAAGTLEWCQRGWQRGDLAGGTLIFAATNDRAVNATIAREAAQAQILCNVADVPEEGTFHLPAIHRDTEAIVAVSTTSGRPGIARNIRDRVARWLQPIQIPEALD